MTRRRPEALYVHLPFCAKHCPYCDFAVTGLDAALEDRYLSALEAEARARVPAGRTFRTIYLGGGTPAELTARGTERLIALLAPHAGAAEEITLEANPRTLLPRKLRRWREGLGVNRVSLGAQSFSARLLQTLGRVHRPRDVDAAVDAVRKAGIEQLSLDLMFAIPGQKRSELEADLAALLRYAPDHVSTYCLTIEPGTPYAAARDAGRLPLAGEAREGRYFGLVRRRLREAGLIHYEISSFARPGHLARHNRIYWRNAAYIGLGNGAASHERGVRSTNLRNVEEYAAAIERGDSPVAEREALEPERKIRETAYLALRTSEGIVPERFLRDTGVDVHTFFAAELPTLLEQGLLQTTADGRIRLSGRGVSLADAVAVELL